MGRVTDLENLLFANVSDDLLFDTTQCVIQAYSEAYDECRDDYPGPVAHDLYPDLRRAKFERNWSARAARFSDVKVTTERNAQNNCYHTRVTSGIVVLTASAVEAQQSLVRDAEFRKSLAGASQLEIFGADADPTASEFLYGIVLHGPLGAGLLRTPQFIKVVIPANDCASYLVQVDLVKRFPVLRDVLANVSDERVQEPAVRLRRRKDEKAG